MEEVSKTVESGRKTKENYDKKVASSWRNVIRFLSHSPN